MRKIVLSIFMVLMLCFSLSAQNQRVSGTVTDSDGKPLIGATVLLKGSTSVAVSTDMDGKYTINVPANGVLQFRYTGYTSKEINVSRRATINVALDMEKTDAGTLIMVGYGSGQKLGSVTSDLKVVKAEVVKDKPVVNVADALQGQVSGLSITTSGGEPGQASEILLHGVGSFTSGTSPLYVIDGVPSTANIFTRLSGNDIEAITILKDASATSIYGSRAANGVIYVTTKKGKRDLTPSIRVNANYGISTPTRIPYQFMSGQELLEWHLEFGEISTGTYNKYRLLNEKNGDFDWFKWVFPNKSIYKAEVAVEGGSQSVNYYVSGGYSNEEGMAPGSYMERFTFRSNLDTQISKWLKMGTNIGLSYDKNAQTFTTAATGGGAYFQAAGMFPLMAPSYFTPYGEKGEPLWFLFGGKDQLSPYWLSTWSPSYNEVVYLNGNAYLNINPLKGLNIRSVFGIEAYDRIRTVNNLPSAPRRKDEGNRRRTFQRSNTLSVTNTIEYKFDLADRKHNFTILAGHEGIDHVTDYFAARGNKMIDDRLMMWNAGSTTTVLGDLEEDYFSYAYLSFFGKVNYDYNDKYFFDLTLRNDASSRFGKNNRNALFYAVSGLWNIKNENFLKDHGIISDLKFRVSYGTQGNSAIDNYEHLNLCGITGSYKKGPGFGIDADYPGNADLSWENQGLFNVGFDIGLWNKLNVNVSYYHRNTYDMLYSIPISLTTGYESRTMNIGGMVNQGVDLDLTWNIFKNKDWNINFSTVFSYNSNRITKLFDGLDEIPGGTFMMKVGLPYGTYYLPEYLGVDPRDGSPIFNDGNGNPTKDVNAANQVITNKVFIAPINGGFNLGATWKGLSLFAQFNYVLGNTTSWWERGYFTDAIFKGYNKPTFMRNIWRKPGDITDIPKYGSQVPGNNTSLLRDLSFLRLKSVTLSYSLPKSLMEKTGLIAGARVFFVGRNLLTITKYPGYDPELVRSIAYGEYPMTRQYTFGVELTF